MQPQFDYAQRTEGLSGSAIREIFKYGLKEGMISFAGGNPGAFALPHEQVASLAQELLMTSGRQLLQYGQTEGYPPLLELLPGYIRDAFNADVTGEQLLVTTGSMQGLDLLLRVLINPGDVILTESPAFLGALQAMQASQARLVPVPCDEDGMDVEALEQLIRQHKPKLLYCIPTFQNPTGRSLSLARRKRVAALAAAHRLVVAEDDPYRQLRYRGEALPSIKAFDEAGYVVLLGSFSKIISPGLRVGFMAGDAQLLRKCCIVKQCTDVHTANLNQAIVAAYLERGLLKPHLMRILPGYAVLLDSMLEGLARMPQIDHYTKPEGGLFVFARLQQGLDARELLQLCIRRGLIFVPGEPFYPEGGHRDTLRLNFSNADQAQIADGLQILADSLNALKK